MSYAEFKASTISIHALRVEGDAGAYNGVCQLGQDFYPRPPGGGRLTAIKSLSFCYISIHALRVEGDKDKNPGAEDRVISIHALRVEGDWMQ